MKTIKQIQTQRRKLLKTMLKYEGTPEALHYSLNGAIIALSWVTYKDVIPPVKQITEYFSFPNMMPGIKNKAKRKEGKK